MKYIYIYIFHKIHYIDIVRYFIYIYISLKFTSLVLFPRGCGVEAWSFDPSIREASMSCHTD